MEMLPKTTIDKNKEENTESIAVVDKNEQTEEQIRENAKKAALEKVKQKASIVNIEELAENEARKGGDANREVEQGKMSWIKKLWQHTFFDEYYRQKEINKVREDIKKTGDIYAGRKANTEADAHENTMMAISDRFTSDYEGTLSDGEEKKMLDDKDPETIKAKLELKNLINDYAADKIDEEAFKTGKNNTIKILKGEDLLKGANNFADNLFEIAQNARLAIKHGAKIEELDYDLDIVVGKAKSSIKTEAHFNMIDKAVDWTKKTPVGKFISPAVVSTAIGLAYSLSVGLSKKLMTSKAAMLFSLGGSVALSTAFAGANESFMVARERMNNDIKFAEGGSTEKGDKRREQLDRYKYTMESSNALAQNLRDLMFEKDKDGKDVLKDIKEEDVDKIIASLSEIDARKSLNATKKIDLISYSGIGNVEKESTDLTILTARAKVELNKKLEGSLKGALKDGKSFEEALAEQTQVVEDSLLGGEKGITAQDKAFRKYKAGRIAKKMAQTAIAGLIIGGTIQEGMAFFKDETQGFIEGMFHQDGGATVQTPFEHLRGLISGNPSHMDASSLVPFDFNGHNISLPEGVSLINNADGTCDILKGDQIISSHFLPTFNASGELDAESIARLGQDGILATAAHQIVEGTKEVTGNAEDWLHNHQGETTNVHRDLFYGNDTSMSVDAETGKTLGSDLNELGTHWGGINGTGINENGDAVLNISHMTPEGSFQDGLSVDAQEAMQKGNLMAMITLDGAHQGQVIPVPIGADGNIIFDHNNPIMQQIFKPDANGQMVSHAKFIEIVQKMGVDANGVEHVRSLSTVVGEGLSSIKDIIVDPRDIPINTLAPSLDPENPLFVPLVARRPLGKAIFDKNGEEVESTEKNPNKEKDIETFDAVLVGDKKTPEVKAVGEGAGVPGMKAIGEGMGTKKEALAISQFSVGNEFGRLEAKEAHRKSKIDLARAANDIEVFKSTNPGEKIPTELEDNLKKAEENVENSKKIFDNAEEEYKKELDKKMEAAQSVATPQSSNKNEDSETAAPVVKKKVVVVKKTTPDTTGAPVVDPVKTPDNSSTIENKFTVEDLEKSGTEIESETGKFTVTERIKKPGFWSFNAFEIKGIFKDKNGVESIVSYDLKEMERLFKKNIIKITKVEEKIK